MTVDPYAQWMGEPMARDDVDQLLHEAGYGVLSMADGDEPYSIPVSFSYDDGVVYFAFVSDSGDNEKFEFIGDGRTVRLLVTDIKARFDWQSVAVSGPVEAISLTDDDWPTLVEALSDNPWFSTDFDAEDGEVTGVQGWRLRPESIHGYEITP